MHVLCRKRPETLGPIAVCGVSLCVRAGRPPERTLGISLSLSNPITPASAEPQAERVMSEQS
jgi:hypothetical protein